MLLALLAADFLVVRAAPSAIEFKLPSTAPAPAVEFAPRPVESWLEAQIALARIGFSSGPIDGIGGVQSSSALRAFQRREHLPPTGRLDAATRARLVLESPPLTQHVLGPEDFAHLQPVSPTWLGKSQQTALDHESVLERVSENAHAHPALVRRLNPGLDWTHLVPGASITLPGVGNVVISGPAVSLRIRLGDHVLEARNAAGETIAHFPVSIARRVEKRPVGELRVTVAIPNPDYTFDPALFSESQEARTLDRKLWIPPGPNNPVGVAWIGLDLPGYGIHGTPVPEHVGRTESHGCFRLANWDARTLLQIVWVGMPVAIEP
jgi:lipoprotein-anchoring transpeptidase ErfK/SrfK